MTESNEGMVSRRSIIGGGVAALTGATIAPAVALGQPRGTRAGTKFAYAGPETPEGFLLDGKPYQIRSGELHPARIPREYWQHRIRMVKALGCNTIALYVMWNHHEPEPGRFDFTTENRDLAQFIRLCAQEGMWVYLRPGPYVCAEWDLGGLPSWLLRDPNMKLRHLSDANYMAAVKRYLAQIAMIARPLMSVRGGPIVMIQVENEYASFGTDKAYLPAIRDIWRELGIDGPFTLSDGLTQIAQAGTYMDGAALGLDGGPFDFAAAQKIAGTAPTWVGEGYPGWLTHWGEPAFAKGSFEEDAVLMMRQRRSFNLYVAHGGSNFGFGAGANANGDGSKFEPSLTSYDYGAPINENGAPTAQYHALRKTIYGALGTTPPPIPATPKLVGFDPVATRPRGSLWNALPAPVATAQPQPMETLLRQNNGMILYRRDLKPGEHGALRIADLHDEALVLVDGRPIGSLSRVAAAKAPAFLQVPPGPGGQARRLDILVFPYGRINYGRYIYDRKGILGAVTLGDRALTGWQAFGLPLDDGHLARMRTAPTSGGGLLHHAEFTLREVGDTYIDMARWKLGFVWVNGHNLGRHSALGPQTRLFCPKGWLKPGRNEVTVLDLYAEPGLPVSGVTMSDSARIAAQRSS